MLIGGKHIEPGTLLACGLCEDEAPTEEPFTAPIDEIGATLMQAHLEDAHGVKMIGVLRTCPECGHSVLCNALKDVLPESCKDHS